MSRIVYTLMFYLGLPGILLRLLYRALRNPGYSRRWAERFGYGKTPSSRYNRRIWVHTVSVGESIAAAPLVRKLLLTFPDYQFVISTMTPTGSLQVTKLYANEIRIGRVLHLYAPYDLPDAVARFLNRIQPKLALFMETELWPNTIAACHQRHIPTLLTNARLSARSARGYGRVGTLTRKMLNQLSFIAAQTDADARRFMALGFPEARLQVTGTLKYDITVPEQLRRQARELRKQWQTGRGNQAPIVIAASTHKGEDEQILDGWRQLRQSFTDALLIIVPRHPERFQTVYRHLQSDGWNTARRSTNEPITINTEVVLGDTMGELMLLYGTADIAFVGGSLVEHGGHNPLEPAALGIPVLSGPHVFNFTEVNKQLQQAGALFTVHNSTELTREAKRLLTNPNLCQQASEAAHQVISQNRGALDRQLQLATTLLTSNQETTRA